MELTGLYIDPATDPAPARELGERLGVACVSEKPTSGLFLAWSEDGLSLSDGTLELRGDFTHLLPRIKSDKLHRELVVRALKVKGLEREQTVADATAGLGEDSFLLAAAGMHVQLFEANPIIAALLEDALRRAAADGQLAAIAARMEFTQGDSVAALPRLQADAVLLDPMFPARRKSAAVKKKLQLIQQLEQPCSSEEELFAAAQAANPRKIAVKRPAKGPFFAGRKPSYSLSGKAVRFDCYV